MKLVTRIALAVVAMLAVIAVFALAKQSPVGADRFYEDQPYHFQTLRVFTNIPYGGADTGEILTTIKKARQGDEESWFHAWEGMATRVEKSGRKLRNPVSRGRALLRAHNYYRTAEFFLAPQDPRRDESFRKSVEVFHDGLDALGVKRELISVPFGDNTLNAIYYPGPEGWDSKPLIMACTGYDGTMEEMYFDVVAPSLERGYSCLTYEGPGQGSILREQGLQFTHEWEKPNAAVLDEFLKTYPRPRKIVFVGISLGGYLAPRAAAFDKRIDGVVAFDVMYSFEEAALKQTPGFVRYLYEKGHVGIVNALMEMRMRFDAGTRWGIQNAMWTVGAKNPVDVLAKFEKYNLEDVSDKITCDVLILAGEKDHFIPLEQVDQFKEKLVNARSVTTCIFTEQEGGHEHCRLGAVTLFNAVLYDWIEEKFGEEQE
jgi:alpha-beta hydrolase superfamily lysophospholipase